MDNISSILESSTISEAEQLSPRKSMSQPSLVPIQKPAEGHPTGFASGSTSNIRNIPIIQTWQENEELKGKLYTLRTDLQMYKYRYIEAKDAAHKSVQEILDDYVTLRLEKDETDKKMEEFEKLNQELISCREELFEAQETIQQNERILNKTKEEMERKIRELEDQIIANSVTPTPDANMSCGNTTVGSFKGTLDDMLKRDDPDFTITGPEEKAFFALENRLQDEEMKVLNLEKQIQELIADLEDKSARLAESENVRAQLAAAAGGGILGSDGANESKTFVIGNVRESATTAQLEYVDELEKKLKDTVQQLNEATHALMQYMNTCSQLEKELKTLKKNSTTADTSSYCHAGTADELKDQIARVNAELNSLRTENRDLRIRCNKLSGGDGNVTASPGQSRILAGISPGDVSQTNATGNVSMRSSIANNDLENCSSYLMDDSAIERMNERDDELYEAAMAEFNSFMAKKKSNNDSLNQSMPPPDKEHTDSFVKMKLNAKSQRKDAETSFGGINSPAIEGNVLQNIPTLLRDLPIMQDVQQILDSSAVILEGGQNAVMDIERMQSNMQQVKEVLGRLFERLKSSAALFEDILEQMGSRSPLADRIRQMKLAFETSINEQADMSNFIDAAERDLTNLSLNFSVLEKSAMNPSFVMDVSRRFSIAPAAEDILSSSLLNNSYAPIFKFDDAKQNEIDQLKEEVVELKKELEKSKNVSIRYECASPRLDTSMLQKQLADVQMKASQNFEELEVCQARLVSVENDKMRIEKELRDLQTAHANLELVVSDTKEEMKEAQKEAEEERDLRVALERDIECLKRQEARDFEENDKMSLELDNVHRELEMTKMRGERIEEQLRFKQSEYQKLVEDNHNLMGIIEELKEFERAQTDLKTKIAEQKSRRVDLVSKGTQVQETIEIGIENNAENQKETLEGLLMVQEKLEKLIEKKMRVRLIPGNGASIRLACEEMCRRLEKENTRRHEQTEVLRMANNALEKKAESLVSLTTEMDLRKPLEDVARNQENIGTESLTKKSTLKFRDPTRQLLHDSTQAVDSIVQKLKKTKDMDGMGPQVKDTIAKIIIDSRALRGFLHNKLSLFKAIDFEVLRSETYEQLVQRLERSYQDFAIVDEECKKLKHEMKKLKEAIPKLGGDVEDRIKKEIGGIARDLGEVNKIRK